MICSYLCVYVSDQTGERMDVMKYVTFSIISYTHVKSIF